MPSWIVLQPLSAEEYADFAERQVGEYARQKVNAEEWTPEGAPVRAREALADLLAGRLRDPAHVFLKGVTADGLRVGWLWVTPAPAFLGPGRERSGRGFGRALMEALHTRLSSEGVEEIWLRVFDWNTTARSLYGSLGYEVMREFGTDAHMRRRL